MGVGSNCGGILVVCWWWCMAAAAVTLALEEDECFYSTDNNDTSPAKATTSCTVRSLSDLTAIAVRQPDSIVRLRLRCDPSSLLSESPLPPRAFHRFHPSEELTVSGCPVPELPVDAFDGLRELKRLKFSVGFSGAVGKTLRLVPGCFDGLRELQWLDLGQSNIPDLPEDVFCTLGNLQVLNLTENGIDVVDSLGFGSTRVECGGGLDLRSLDLSANRLTTLSDRSGLNRFRRLHELYLQDNSLTKVGSDSLQGLTSLRVLNMSNNRLDALPEGLLAASRELREIYLQSNALYELSRGLFHRLEQLLVLDLSNNQLSSNQVDEGTFVGLIRLIVLNLSHNALTRLDAKTFKDLFFLQILDLRNNSIGYIENNAFLPLYNLHTLNLAENRLHHITAHLFNGLFVLTKLTLNNNLIVNIDPQAFRNCSDLKDLDLSSNAIQEVPEALSELSFLKTLDLGENQISGFRNGSFRNLQQLTGLRLIDNDIGNLTRGMFWDLTGLQVLNLAKNKVQQIERGTFERNTQLEAIRLDANYLTDINGVFSTLASLLWLNLSENHLVWFDYAFVPSTLKWLDIHGNYIEKLGNYYRIHDQLHMKTLDASHNRITELSEASVPNSVEVVFINNNLISEVRANTFLEKTNLARVDMYANEMVRLDLNALRLSPVPLNRTLPEFYLGGNPFHCDCSMDWLPAINNMTGHRQYPMVMDLENVVCRMTYSRGSAHSSAVDSKPSQFLCRYETHCFTICHCCDFDACDCEMTCPKNCSCYHDQTWSTNVVDCSGQANDRIPKRIPMDATHVYLDGNDFKELQNHVFIGRKNMRALFVNGSRVQTIQNRTFNGLNALRVLHLEDNLIAQLKGYEFDHLSQLRELYLQNNRIAYIGNSTLFPLKSLEILRLDGNRLVDFPVWQLTLNSYLVEVSLGNNRWSCRCKFLKELQAWVRDNRRKVSDGAEIWCYMNDTRPPHRREVDLNSTACSDYYSDGSGVIQSLMVSDYLPMAIVTFSAFIIVVLLSVATYLFRDPVRVWLYSRYGVRLFHFKAGAASKHCGEDREKLYDGYVVYSPKDEEFVLQSIVAELEHGSPPFHLCLHYRDLPNPSAPYLTSSSSPVVVEAAEASRRVILVLSRNFLQTEWSRFEFRSALHEALKGRVFKLVLVEEGSILPAEAELDPDLRPYLKTGTRIRWGEKRFWERLRYVMPSDNRRHKQHPGTKSCNYNQGRNINNYSLDSTTTAASATLTMSAGGGVVPLHNHGYVQEKNHHHHHEPTEGVTLPPPPAYKEEANYSSATTATPSPRPVHRHHPHHHNHHHPGYADPDRPPSEHIYSSIESPPDYPTANAGSQRQQRHNVAGAPPPPWRTAGAAVLNSGGVQAYLV